MSRKQKSMQKESEMMDRRWQYVISSVFSWRAFHIRDILLTAARTHTHMFVSGRKTRKILRLHEEGSERK